MSVLSKSKTTVGVYSLPARAASALATSSFTHLSSTGLRTSFAARIRNVRIAPVYVESGAMRALLLLLLLALPAAAQGLDGKTVKKMEAFGARWWKARPQTKFHKWSSKERAALTREAKAFGAIPEGSFEAVRAALWKSIKKYGPKGKGGAKLYIEPKGYKLKMWAGVSGRGKNQGLIMSLHGGGKGAGSSDGSWQWKGCITIAPQGLLLHGDNWNRVHGEKQILTYIEIAKAQWNVDPDRVYCCGFSMGGTGSWHMAGRFPDLLAGAAPCAGVLMAQPKSQLKSKEEIQTIQYGLVPNVRNLAMYYFIGLEDVNCMPGTYLYVADMLEELKKEDPTGYTKIRFKTYPGLAHAYPPGEPGNAFKYLSQQRRDSYPEKIVWQYALQPHPLADGDDGTGRYIQRWFYNLYHANPRDKMEVIVERKGNEFDVEAIGGENENLYLMLNPKMIDVKQDVIVRVDGEEIYRGKPQPDFWTVVQSLDSRLDRTLTFDRRVALWKDE